LEHLDYLALALAGLAPLHVLAALARAFLADAGALVGHLQQIAVVDVLEGYFECPFGWLDLWHLFLAGAFSSAPEEHVEDVRFVLGFGAFLPVSIVVLAEFWVL
jgi:hypothetical protein